jgi:HD superfamily phosphohydrolase
MFVRIADRIYGHSTIEELLLVELLNCPAIKRLQSLYMGGIVGLLGAGPRATRYEHSVGAMLLVRKLCGSVEQQAAALLHDVSHTALSHVIDYVLDSPSRQAFHDDRKEDYLAGTNVPDICERHGVDWRLLADEAHWPLLEQEAPRLCADRVDYTWRDVEAVGAMTAAEVSENADALVASQGRMAFSAERAARVFAEAYLACNELCWMSPRGLGLYMMAADALRLALERGVIHQHELWTTDDQLWRRIVGAPDAKVRRLAERVNSDTTFSQSPDGEIRVFPKIRFVDPDVMTDGQLVPLSEIDASWCDRLNEYLATAQGEWRLRAERRGA